jgi:tellurite resistance protein
MNAFGDCPFVGVPNSARLAPRTAGRIEESLVSTTRIPLNLFGVPFGLAGLGGSWLTIAGYGHTSTGVGNTILALAAAVWLVILLAYVRSVVRDRSTVVRDLLDPVTAPFAALVVITPMLLSAEGVYPHAHTAGRALLDVFLVLTVLLGAWFTGQWIYGPMDLDKFHPGFFLPTVAGGLVAAACAAEVGEHRLAETMFGLGMICWLVLGSIIMGRLLFRPLLPAALLPTLAIEVAPAAVASLAYFAIHGDRIDSVVAFLGGYGLLMVLAQMRLLPAYARLHFMPSTWAFTFSWAAVASVAMHWLNDTKPSGHVVYEYLVLAAITALIGAIAVRTVLAIGRGQLLPHPAAATDAGPAATAPHGRETEEVHV